MRRIVSPQLIRDYLAGRCTPEEAQQVRQWYDSFGHQTDPMDALSAGERAALKEMMYQGILERLRAEEALPEQYARRTPQRRRSFRRIFLGAAAAAVLLFISLRVVFDKPRQEPVTASSATAYYDDPAPVAAPADIEEIVIRNQRKNIRREELSDGTVVWLQPGTWIAFPPAFESAQREVRMSGEAFFEVSEDASRPFIVYSGDLVTRVLGTSFNIRAYKDSSSAEVSVFTGQVSVSLPASGDRSGERTRPEKELLLVKDEKAIFFQHEKLLKKRSYNVKKEPELNIWEKNTISFNNTPVKEVVQSLNREFGVSLRVAADDQELNNYLLKADFTDQNLPDILQMLEKSLSLTYEIAGNEIVLKIDK